MGLFYVYIHIYVYVIQVYCISNVWLLVLEQGTVVMSLFLTKQWRRRKMHDVSCLFMPVMISVVSFPLLVPF